MVPTIIKKVSLSEFLQLPETEPPREYIDGEIIPKPMPQGEHSAIQTELASAINSALKSQRIARAFNELRCTFGGRSIIPDLAVFSWERIPRKENGSIANLFEIAPDWTIEILSPDQNQTKVTKNILHCLKYNSKMGWLIDPEERSVFIYSLDRPSDVIERAEQILPVPEFARNFNITLEELFNWLLD